MSEIEEVRELVTRAARVVAFTGAGISAESGIPTFRGIGSLWKHPAEELATPEAFERDPKVVWEWYLWRRQRMAAADPNAGHLALAELERWKPEFVLITQNIDGLHDRAGSRRILKLHGDVWSMRCTKCFRRVADRRLSIPELPPKCECGGIMRPDVVWFREFIAPSIFMASEAAASRAEVFLAIGTSAMVYPAAGLLDRAESHGATLVEVNPANTPYTGEADYKLAGAAGDILPQILTPSPHEPSGQATLRPN